MLTAPFAASNSKLKTTVTRNEIFQLKYLNCPETAEGNIGMSSHCVSNRTLVHIEEELETDEEEVIRFACRDISATSNVRELLHELNEDTSHPVILELLHLLKRFDLIKKHYRMTKVEAEKLLKKTSKVISDYRYFVIDLSEQIEERDLESLVFLLKNDLKGGKQKIKTFLSLIVELEKNQLITPSNLEILENVFPTIQRVDLRNNILKFLKKDNANCGGPYINAHPASASCYRSSSASSVMIPQLLGSSTKDPLPVQETLSQFGVHDERYPVRKESLGFCVIIDCVGNDADMIQALFRSIHFVVQCHLYKNVAEVEEILHDVANMEQHRNHDIFACFIISRGSSDSLFCLDGELPGLSLERIKNVFTGQKCPNLRGKPKLFFLQNYFVCDIEETQEESFLEVDGPREDAAIRQRIQNYSRIPNEADIFWSHCRVNELELQRSSGSTSLYLRSLRDLLNEKETRKHRDLLDIHTELNRIIYAKKAGYSLQLRHTLTKKLFIYPA
ncbi:CASP8 and FADD-like apoptosis regulator isoform X2 [Hyla sarda]|uniref:CASP8 and FADD-like apoptosis regulator isoform X2 n=1 Tax=Hyla sarda TaxID=327740 RepID=UPI0024C2470E|nr:CASP8 and FADD-like apoptosis regulator isoform X2 [Hyla sarda]